MSGLERPEPPFEWADERRVARGVLIGVALGVVLWAAIIAAIAWWWS